MAEQKLYLRAAAEPSAAWIFYVSHPAGAADGKVSFAAAAPTLAGVLSGYFAAAGHAHALADIAGAGALASADAVNGSMWSGADLAIADGGTGASTPAAARTNLGLAIGADVQAHAADLDALAALSGTNTLYYRSGAAAWSPVTVGSGLSFSGGTLDAAGGGGGAARVLIAEVVTSGSASNVTFSSIPATYRDLELVVRGRGTATALAAAVQLQFNSDTSANYHCETVRYAAAVSAILESRNQNQIAIAEIPAASAATNYAGFTLIRIFDYRGTVFFKHAIGHAGGATGGTATTQEIGMFSGAWVSTSAINAIKVFLSSGAFADGTVVSLYGLT